MRQVVIFLASGWAGLIVMALQLLCGQFLAPFFGSTVNIWGAVLCAFLIFISLGYLTGSSLSKMGPSVRMLGVFLFAAAALCIPAYAQWQTILFWIATHLPHPSWAALLGTVALFAGAAYVLGMVTPYAMRLLHAHQGPNSSAAGWLYFTATIGGAIGAIMTSFYLILWLTLTQIMLSLMIISVIIGLLTFFVAKGDDGY